MERKLCSYDESNSESCSSEGFCITAASDNIGFPCSGFNSADNNGHAVQLYHNGNLIARDSVMTESIEHTGSLVMHHSRMVVILVKRRFQKVSRNSNTVFLARKLILRMMNLFSKTLDGMEWVLDLYDLLIWSSYTDQTKYNIRFACLSFSLVTNKLCFGTIKQAMNKEFGLMTRHPLAIIDSQNSKSKMEKPSFHLMKIMCPFWNSLQLNKATQNLCCGSFMVITVSYDDWNLDWDLDSYQSNKNATKKLQIILTNLFSFLFVDYVGK